MYCSSKLHTSTLPSQSQLASQLSSPVHMLRSYCHFQFTVLEVIFLTLTYLSEDWVVGIPEPVCAQTQKSVDSCSRILAPDVTSSDQSVLLACSRMLPLYSMLLSPYCSGGHVLRPESLRELGTQFLSDVSDKATFSSHPVHTRCPPWPRLGHAPRAISCPRHDGILFIAYIILSKSFVRHGSQHALAEETVTKHSRNLHERRTGVSQSEPEDARARHFCVMGRSSRK